LLELGEADGLWGVEELTCYGTGAVVKVTVEDRYDEVQLSALSCVDEWDYVAETDAGHVYVIDFTHRACCHTYRTSRNFTREVANLGI